MTEKTIFRMSSIGKCPRALTAEHLSLPSESTPDWLETAANEGRWHEKRIRQELEEEGVKVYDIERELVLDFPTFTLIGHIDGMVEYDGKAQLLEIKSMSFLEYRRWKKGGFAEYPVYADQLTAYMEATKQREARYIVKDRSGGAKNDFVIFGPLTDFNFLVSKLTQVQQAIEAGELYPAEFDVQSIECRRCNYKSLCLPIEVAEMTEQTEKSLHQAADMWREGDSMIDEGKSLKGEANKIFERHLGATGNLNMRWDELGIVHIFVGESVQYSKKDLLEVFGEKALLPAAKVKAAHDYIKITDLRRDA